jgi:hypothetical protein
MVLRFDAPDARGIGCGEVVFVLPVQGLVSAQRLHDRTEFVHRFSALLLAFCVLIEFRRVNQDQGRRWRWGFGFRLLLSQS